MNYIVITGPESSGKTTLAQKLTGEFDLPYIPEYARVYLEQKGKNYVLEDIVNIAIGQLAVVESVRTTVPDKPYLILDTWMLELRIWSQYRFRRVPEIIEQLYHEHLPAFYVLCTPDLAWTDDPLRENPHDRDELFALYQNAIEESDVPYVTISGKNRDTQARPVIRELMMQWQQNTGN